MRIKTCSFIALFSVLTLGLNAQGNQLSYQVNTGISIPILDNGTGIQIGFNPTWMLSDYVGLEGQVSYNYMVLSGTFISGKTGHAQALNALVGGRVYVIPPDKKVRLF
ncbi:MAG: hypothetical protein KDC24_12590, partial [Saprospiraceae bacterium]|nr:hypothetical protein [Saprospiraceae bacterium]